jgi:ribose transport system substrate-binding protein
VQKKLLKMGRAALILLVLVATMGFAGGQKAAKEGEITVGFNAMNVSMTWMVFAKEAMEQAAKDMGVKLIVLDAENDVSKQAANMEDLVALGVQAIITDPIDVNSLTPAINKAAEEGVPTATFDRAALGANYAFYVGCDDVEGGRKVADFVADKLGGRGKIVFLTGTPGSSPARDREKGLKEQLKKYPNLQIVFEQTGEFYREKGMQVMEDAITAVPDFDAVVCQNDDMMMGAIEAVQAAGIDPQSKVIVGFDGVPDGLRAVRDGLADATVQYPVGQAAEVLKRVVSYLKGNPPAEKDYEMPPWIITKENLDSGDFYSLIKND